MAKAEILGIPYDNVTLPMAVNDVLAMAKGEKTRYVVTPNPEISEGCAANPDLRKAVCTADYVIPDGIGVIMASRILSRPLKERVGGYDLAKALLPRAAKEGLRIFLLGAKPGVAEKAAENMRRDNPSIRILGTHDGYFQDDVPVISKINALHPDILFVALGSPRQEIWMCKNREKVRAGVMMGLGGGLDVFAGVVKRAPKFFVRLNLEWFYRLIKQPWRFIRMLKLPKYILRAVCARLKSGRL